MWNLRVIEARQFAPCPVAAEEQNVALNLGLSVLVPEPWCSPSHPKNQTACSVPGIYSFTLLSIFPL